MDTRRSAMRHSSTLYVGLDVHWISWRSPVSPMRKTAKVLYFGAIGTRH